MGVWALLFSLAAVFGGAVVRGYTGFGSALIWVSSLSLVLPPVAVVPTVFILDVVASAHLMPKVWKDIHWRSLRWLLAGALVATPPGLYLLAAIPPSPLRAAIALVVLTATVLIWRGFALRAIPGAGPAVATGLLAGALNGSTGIGGPPAILFYFSSPAGIGVSRASVIAFLMGIDVYGAAVASAQGLVGAEVLLRTAILVPAVLIGTVLGNRRFIRTNPETFRRYVLIVLGGLSVAVFARAVLG